MIPYEYQLLTFGDTFLKLRDELSGNFEVS